MSTTSPTPYVPYQAYKSKRHSRVISSPSPPNGAVTTTNEQPNQARMLHTPSSSVELTPNVNGEAASKQKDDVAPSDNDASVNINAWTFSSRTRPTSMIILPQRQQQQQTSAPSSMSSEQTSPTSPGAKSIGGSVAGIRINGEPLGSYSHSQSTTSTEPSSPASVRSIPGLSLNGSPAATSDCNININGKGVAFPFPSEKAAGKAPASAASEAGPSTPSTPSTPSLPSKPALNPRRTSTFRYVSLRGPNSANAVTGSFPSSAPRTSSPLRPVGHGHNRVTSTSGTGAGLSPSPLSSARQLGDQPSPLQAPASRSPASVHSDLSPDTPVSQSSLLRPGLGSGISTSNAGSNSYHHRSTSMTVSPRINPPQRTSSLTPDPHPPIPPPKPSSPSIQPILSPALTPAHVSTSISTTSSRVQSPTPSTPISISTSTSSSTATATPTSTYTYKTAYRPGFQPKGVYRPLTDEFLALRKHARDKGRIEQTRLERRFEKLVDLHFCPTSTSSTSASSAPNSPVEEKVGGSVGVGLRGKPSRPRPRPSSGIFESTGAPVLARRASSLFEELGELRSKGPSELWRSMLESRTAAANGGKGDIRAAEQRITPWQDDAEVSACPHCSASFHPLTNRKHHCRLCGRIICSLPVKPPQRSVPCSLLFISDPKTGQIEKVTEGVDYGVKPRARTDSRVGLKGQAGQGGGGGEEKQGKGVRICKDCKPVMLRQKLRQEAKRVPAMVRLYEALISLESEIEESLPQFQELMLSLSNNLDEAPTKEASLARKHLLQCFADYDAIAKRIRKIPCPGGPGSSQDRVQSAIQARANMFLQKNMFPLQSLPKPKKRSSVGSATASGEAQGGDKGGDKEILDPDSELARALQPLLEQEALLESFVEEATRHRKFEDARTLKANLAEIRGEIDRIVASADGPQVGWR